MGGEPLGLDLEWELLRLNLSVVQLVLIFSYVKGGILKTLVLVIFQYVGSEKSTGPGGLYGWSAKE